MERAGDHTKVASAPRVHVRTRSKVASAPRVHKSEDAIRSRHLLEALRDCITPRCAGVRGQCVGYDEGDVVEVVAADVGEGTREEAREVCVDGDGGVEERRLHLR
jgi:hypothetical protein